MSLRLSAYLRALCVKTAISTQRAQRYAESRREDYLELTLIVCVAVLPATS